MAAPSRAGRLIVGAFLLEAILAGGNGVAIGFSNLELPPLWGAGLRFGIAAMLALAVTAVAKAPLPRGKPLVGAALFGLFQFAGAFGLYYFALVEILPGLGQTLLALVPLATLILAVSQGQERLQGAAVIGSLIGVAGVAVISRQALEGSISPPSLIAVFGSVLCFAEALVLVRQLPPIHPLALNAVGMVAAAPVLIVASAIAGERFILPERLETWIAVGYVAIIGSVVVFLLHVWIVQRWGASRTAHVMLLVPFVTVAVSAWLLREPITAGLVIGGVLIIAGVYFGALHRGLTVRSSTRGTRAP